MIYLLIALHFLSDFKLQTRAIAENKSSSYKYLLIHMSIIYAVLGIFAVFTDIPQLIVLIYVICHGIQDKLVWSFFKKKVYEREDIDDYIKYNLHTNDSKFWDTLALDQCIHICLMLVLFTPYL